MVSGFFLEVFKFQASICLVSSIYRWISLSTGLPMELWAVICYLLQVQALLEVLPNRLTADVLEQLRISKQTLVLWNWLWMACMCSLALENISLYGIPFDLWKVELGSRAGALRQMLLDLLEDTEEIRRICIMGRNCTLKRGHDDVECSVPLEKQIAEGKLCKSFLLPGFLEMVQVHIQVIEIGFYLICSCYMQKRRKKLRCCWKIIFKGYFLVQVHVKHICSVLYSYATN